MDYLTLVRKCLEKEKSTLEESLAHVRRSTREAPTAMESHSDTSRAYYENLAAEFTKKIEVLNSLLSMVPQSPPTGAGVQLWSCVETEIKNVRRKVILVPEGAGGKEIEGYILLSVSAPLGQKILRENAVGTV